MTSPARKIKRNIPGIPVRLEQSKLKGLKVARANTGMNTPIETLPPRIAAKLEREIESSPLQKPLDVLDKETEHYRTEETVTSHISIVDYPDLARFQVTISDRGAKLDIFFPKERDLDPKAANAGMIGDRHFPGFPDYVKELTGQEMKKVRIFIEKGVFQYEGKNTKYITAYIFPLNEKGEYITKTGKGTYLVWEASQFGYEYVGGMSIVKEPGNADSLRPQ